jgi:hypothetical protein
MVAWLVKLCVRFMVVSVYDVADFADRSRIIVRIKVVSRIDNPWNKKYEGPTAPCFPV